MEKNGNLNTFLFTNQTEYNISSSSSDEESYESNEEQEDNDRVVDNIVEDLKDLKINNNDWKEEIPYEKNSLLSFFNNNIHTNIIKESLEEKFLTSIRGKDLSPEYFFKLIIDNKLIDNICQWTNEYYHKVLEPFYNKKQVNFFEKNNQSYYSHHKKWEDVTTKEIYIFILIYIYLGIIKLPNVYMNWSTNIYLKQNWIKETITFDRYKQINKSIRFSSKSFNSKEKEDKYHDFMKSIISNSNIYYKASNIKSIDESMVKFSGRAKYIIYMRNKPIKWGFKLYVLCDSLNGFCLDILPHIGKKKFTTSFVISFLINKLNKNDYLFMDRYYSGIDIYLGLYEKGIKATGTIMTNNANLPKDKFAEIKLKKYESKVFNYDNKLRFLIWQDKKPIYILSNVYNGYIITKTKLDHSKKQLNLIKIPYMISEYNKYMGGIDRMDHYLSTYISNHRSKKWYKKIIVYMINVALNNANILYNLYLEKNGRANEKLKSLDFRLCILGIKDTKKEIKNNNKIDNSIKIIKDPKQPTIIESFNKNSLVLENDMEICIHESMMCQKECIICRKENPFINSRLIRTQYGCKLHNEWVCKKKNNYLYFYIKNILF